VIVVSGAIVSIVHAAFAGVGSVLPAASVARTRNACGPSARNDTCAGVVHLAQGPSSSEHSKVLEASSDENAICALEFVTSGAGAVMIVVSGATESAWTVGCTCGVGCGDGAGGVGFALGPGGGDCVTSIRPAA
jgi:hypothetical protein